MADLKIQDFETLVRNQVLAIQGRSTSLVDLTVGSVLRALVEAYSAIAIWLQAMILQVIVITRASTSTGQDLDSWMADFGVSRVPATISTGVVTFSRFTYTAQAVIPIGSIVQSADGTQQYEVIVDSSNGSYSIQVGGYVVPAGAQKIDVPVRSISFGAATNASIGGINTIGQAIPGIDTVTNMASLTNGADAESDYDLRKRFIAYILSLSKATRNAVYYATTSIRPGISCKIIENKNYDGTENIGYFYVVVDDGTGSPTSDFISFVYNSVDEVRPLGVRFSVFPPSIKKVSVSMAVTSKDGYDQRQVVPLVLNAITNHINTLGLGAPLLYTKIAQVAYEASNGVMNVSNLRVNNDIIDVLVDDKTVIKADSVSIG